MKSRDIFLPSLGSILIAGMVAFLSCAHQNRNAEDMDMPTEDMTSESSPDSSQNNAEQASNMETTSTANDLSSSDSSSDLENLSDSKTTPAEDSTASLDKDLESLDSQVSPDTATPKADTQTASKEPSLEEQLEGVDSNKSSSLESGPSLGRESAAGTVALNSDPEQKSNSADIIQPKTDELNAKESITSEVEPISKETLNMDKKPSKNSFRVSSRIPKIPAKAINKKGAKLNRFYFVRKGDTPKKVATLIYGSSKASSKLTQWNGKSWTPGKVIYYVSAQNPKDLSMDSFYKENGISAEEYTVNRGEWLSKIAWKRLGSPNSWTEIAVVNGINKPKSLEVGQKIAIYPVDLKPTQETVIAKNEPVQQPPVVEAAPVQPPPVVEPPVQKAQVEEPAPTPVAPPKEPVKTAPVGFNLQKFIEQNMFAGLMGLAGFFLILLLIVKKKNKARANAQDDFLEGDEGFQPPTKLKRK